MKKRKLYVGYIWADEIYWIDSPRFGKVWTLTNCEPEGWLEL